MVPTAVIALRLSWCKCKMNALKESSNQRWNLLTGRLVTVSNLPCVEQVRWASGPRLPSRLWVCATVLQAIDRQFRGSICNRRRVRAALLKDHSINFQRQTRSTLSNCWIDMLTLHRRTNSTSAPQPKYTTTITWLRARSRCVSGPGAKKLEVGFHLSKHLLGKYFILFWVCFSESSQRSRLQIIWNTFLARA